jgi:integrase
MPLNLNAKTVAGLVLPAGKSDAIFFDSELPGFGYRLRKSTGGSIKKSWVAQYRHGGRTRRVLIGSAATISATDARAQAKKILATAALGNDPQAAKHERRGKDAISFRCVVDEFLAFKRSRIRPRTYGEICRYLTDSHFRPFHARAIDTIGRKDIAARLIAITRENGSTSAARAKAVISSLYSWAMSMGLVEANPVIGTVNPQGSRPRDRVLSSAELAVIWRASEPTTYYGKIIRLLILLGARRQEIGGMQWPEFDAAGNWTLPAPRAKNGRAHTLQLPAEARVIIDDAPRMLGRDFLFGTRGAKGFNTWHEGKAALDAKLGDAVAPWRVHDIRRSVATCLADIGVQPHIIEQILNHQSGHKRGPAGIYNRSTYQNEVRAALALWADHVLALAEGRAHKVVPLRKA